MTAAEIGFDGQNFHGYGTVATCGRSASRFRTAWRRYTPKHAKAILKAEGLDAKSVKENLERLAEMQMIIADQTQTSKEKEALLYGLAM